MAMKMTDEEAEALDAEFTNGSLRLSEGTGPIMRRREFLRRPYEANYSYTMALADSGRKESLQIIRKG